MNDPILINFHEASKKQFLDVKPETILPFLDTPFEDVYTIVARPNQSLISTIGEIQKEYSILGLDQFFYPSESLHMTILGGIPSSLDQEKLKSVFRETIKSKLICKAWGTASNLAASSISLYPENFSFHSLREELRTKLGVHGTDFTTYISTYEYVGWINIMRYKTSPKVELLQAIGKYLEKDFGTFEFDRFQLLRISNLVLSAEKTTLIDEIRLDSI